MAAGKARRRPGGIAGGRARHRQIAHRGQSARAGPARAAHSVALLLLTRPFEQRALPHHQPDRACGRLRARGQRRGQGGQIGGPGLADRDAERRSRGHRGPVVAADHGRRHPARVPAAAQTADAGDAAARARPSCPRQAGADHVRRPALGRSDQRRDPGPHDRGYPAHACAGVDLLPARLRSSLDRAAAGDAAHAEPAQSGRCRDHRRAHRRQGDTADRRHAGDRRAHYRRSTVRRGAHEGHSRSRCPRTAGSRRTLERSVADPRGAGRAECLVDGAARSSRLRQGGGADRRHHRATVLLRPAGGGGAAGRQRVDDGRRPVSASRTVVSVGHAREPAFSLQACPGAGRGLCRTAARAAPGTACAHRAGLGGTVSRNPRAAPRNAGSSLRRGGVHRKGRHLLGQGRATVGLALGIDRGDRPIAARARSDRQSVPDNGPAPRPARTAGDVGGHLGPHQGLRRARGDLSLRGRPLHGRAPAGAWGIAGGSTAAVLGDVRAVGRTLCGDQRRPDARARTGDPHPCRAAEFADLPAARPSTDGHIAHDAGRVRGRADASRSRRRALSTGGASPARRALQPGSRRVGAGLSLMDAVAPRLSRCGAGGRRPPARRGPRSRTGRHPDLCPVPRRGAGDPVRQDFRGRGARA